MIDVIVTRGRIRPPQRQRASGEVVEIEYVSWIDVPSPWFVVEESAVIHEVGMAAHQRSIQAKNLLFMGIMVVLIVLTSYVAYNTWQIDNHLRQQFTQQQ